MEEVVLEVDLAEVDLMAEGMGVEEVVEVQLIKEEGGEELHKLRVVRNQKMHQKRRYVI
jgi:hypothetical protein